MFSLAHALPSPASAEENSSLFGWFIGSMAWSDSSETSMPALRLWAFSGRPRFGFFRGAPEVSRFSCLLFLSVRGSSTTQDRLTTRVYRDQPCCLPRYV